jgi:hypothetical protein
MNNEQLLKDIDNKNHEVEQSILVLDVLRGAIISKAEWILPEMIKGIVLTEVKAKPEYTRSLGTSTLRSMKEDVNKLVVDIVKNLKTDLSNPIYWLYVSDKDDAEGEVLGFAPTLSDTTHRYAISSVYQALRDVQEPFFELMQRYGYPHNEFKSKSDLTTNPEIDDAVSNYWDGLKELNQVMYDRDLLVLQLDQSEIEGLWESL